MHTSEMCSSLATKVMLWRVGAASQGLLGSMFMGQEDRVLADQQRQQLVLSSSVPSTVVRIGTLTSMPGRQSQLSFSQVRPLPYAFCWNRFWHRAFSLSGMQCVKSHQQRGKVYACVL